MGILAAPLKNNNGTALYKLQLFFALIIDSCIVPCWVSPPVDVPGIGSETPEDCVSDVALAPVVSEGSTPEVETPFFFFFLGSMKSGNRGFKPTNFSQYIHKNVENKIG